MLGPMRTTVDLPADLHHIARAIAADEGRSLSSVVSDLMRRGLSPSADPAGELPTRNGIPQLRLYRRITTEDVRGLDDE